MIEPRDYTLRAGMACGLPSDRGARIAARQAFADLKRTFLHALAPATGGEHIDGADWLRSQVQRAEEPVDLWLLRAAMFDVLAGSNLEHRHRRQALRRGLDSMFRDLEPASGFAPL